MSNSETDSLLNACDQFIVLALFEGIYGKNYSDIEALTMEDFKGNEVYLKSGEVLKVSDKLIDLAEESARTFEYYIYSEKNENGVRFFK